LIERYRRHLLIERTFGFCSHEAAEATTAFGEAVFA
jgi:hypothetical protein